MIEKPFINILVRTSGRPLYFKKCIESIKIQNYNNYRILISYDNEEDLWNQLLRCNDLFHRGLLSLSYRPQEIIGESVHLEWPSIFSTLERDPFEMDSF